MENNHLPAKKDNTSPANKTEGSAYNKRDFIHRFENHVYDGIRSVNVTGDSRYLIISMEGSKGIIRVLDLGQLSYLPHTYEGHRESVRLTSVTSDNQAFYTASWDWSHRRFEIATGLCTRILMGQGRSPSCMVDPEEKFLFSASYDGDLDLNSRNNGRCWDLRSVDGPVINIYRHTRERKSVECVDIAYDGQIVVTGSDDGVCLKWSLLSKEPLLEYFQFDGAVRKICLSENILAAASTDGLIRTHRKDSGAKWHYLQHSNSEVRDVKISSDETMLYSASEDGSVKCFDLIAGKEIFHRQIHHNWIWSICLCYDDRVLVTGSSDGSVAFISAKTGELLARLQNIMDDQNVLFYCPSSELFSGGFFYTNNPDYIHVYTAFKAGEVVRKLEPDDPERMQYINMRNLKNLVMAKIKNDGSYCDLSGRHLEDLKLIRQGLNERLPLMLR